MSLTFLANSCNFVYFPCDKPWLNEDSQDHTSYFKFRANLH